MVLTGLVNKRIVQAIMDEGGRAVGLSGKDDDLIVCEADDPELGFVGRPIEMNVQVLRDLFTAGIIPVIAPVATGMDPNETFNVNGDTAAGAIAGALKADRLLLLTDVPGVKDASGEVVTQLTPDQVRAMIADGTIAGGMIPKVGDGAEGDRGGRAGGGDPRRPAAQRDAAGAVHRAWRGLDHPLHRTAGEAARADERLSRPRRKRPATAADLPVLGGLQQPEHHRPRRRSGRDAVPARPARARLLAALRRQPGGAGRRARPARPLVGRG